MIAAALTVTLLVISCHADVNTSARMILESSNVSGVAAVRLGYKNKVVSVQVGFADFEAKIPLQYDTRYAIASNTKLYVAVSLYQLHERGLINITSSIANYLDAADFAKFGHPNLTRYCPVIFGDLSNKCQTITFVQLLDMSSGIPNTDGLQFMPYPGAISAFVGYFITTPLLFEPGTQYYYSNPSFMLASYFIQKYSGMSFEAYLRKNIFNVIGLKNTYYDPYNGKYKLDPLRTREYYNFIDPTSGKLVSLGTCSSEFDLGSASGAGGIVSTQDDEATMYYTLFNFTEGAYGYPLVSKESLMSIVKPRTQIGVNSTVYFAQGLFVVSNGSSVPPVIQYEGGIMCSLTANVFDMTVSPPVMSQVWSSVRVAYVNEGTLDEAASAREGNFFAAFNSWPQQTPLPELAWQIRRLFP